jgi:S1-C subfamily serine protease
VQTANSLVIGGDLIVKVAGKAIAKPDDLAAAISSKKPGDKVDVQFYHGNKLKTVTVTLGNRPASMSSSESQTFPFP